MKCIRMAVLLVFFLYQNGIGFAAEPVIIAQITNVSGDEITIGNGEDSGVFEGAEGFVYYMHTIGGKSVRLTIARVKVISVSSRRSRLRVIDKTADIIVGYLVEIQVLPEIKKEPVLPEVRKEPVLPEVTKEPSVEKPQKKSKMKWYIIGGAVVIGGVVAASMGGGGGGDDNGTAVIDVTFPD